MNKKRKTKKIKNKLKLIHEIANSYRTEKTSEESLLASSSLITSSGTDLKTSSDII